MVLAMQRDRIGVGEVVRADHAVVKGREQLFEPRGADAPPDHE